MRFPPILVLTGATCTGKTAASALIARELDGEVICCDSRQLFKGMEIGSAQPTAEEMMGIPHHLFGILEPKESCSAGGYRNLAEPVVQDLISRKRLPILSGGTGLYIRAFLGPASLPPPASRESTDKANDRIEQKGLSAAWAELSEIDPASAAAIHPNDRYRIVRALSVYIDTGRSISEWRTIKKTSRYHAIQVAFSIDRETLYSRINDRCARMLESGMIREAEKLREAGYADCPPVKKTIGYGHVYRALNGEIDFSQALTLIQRDTRRYAKRQMTWLRGQVDVHWIDAADPEVAASAAAGYFRQALENSGQAL